MMKMLTGVLSSGAVRNSFQFQVPRNPPGVTALWRESKPRGRIFREKFGSQNDDFDETMRITK
jgi:hypothetical protein